MSASEFTFQDEDGVTLSVRRNTVGKNNFSDGGVVTFSLYEDGELAPIGFDAFDYIFQVEDQLLIRDPS